MSESASGEYQNADNRYWEDFGESEPGARYREYFEAIRKAVRGYRSAITRS